MPRRSQPPIRSKICVTCGRPFDDRGKWRRRGQWDEVKYCSTSCRAKRPKGTTNGASSDGASTDGASTDGE